MTKVLLIFPPYSLKEEFGNLSEVGNMQQPLGVGYLGVVLEEAGFEVKIIDAPPLGWGIKQIVAETKKFQPDFIGLSVSTVDFNKAVKLAWALKKSWSVPIIIGGPHVTALPEEVMKFSCFDIGVIGEGEVTIVELTKALVNKRNLMVARGIVFRQGRKIIKTNPQPYIENLDSLPFPARHLMPVLSSYHPTPATYKKFPVGKVITSRGCPYQCTFCFRGVFGNKLRFRSPESVVAEMEVLISQFGAKEIRLWDDTFNANPERVKAICQLMIKRGLKFPWTCLGRVDRVDCQMLKLMKKAGCWQISYGVESGNEEILVSIKKGITKKMVREAIGATYKAGIQSLGFFILGLPGDTEETMKETIEFAKSLPLDAANFTIATPYPGTELWDLAKKRGFLKNISYEKLVVNLPKKPYYTPEGISVRKLKEYERRAYREFYRHPQFLLRHLGEIESLPEFWRKLRSFFIIQSV